MVWRKLTYKRTKKFIEDLEAFIRGSVGKRYELSVKKLLNKKDSGTDANDPDKAYFCSELIAAAYKALGL